MLRTRKVLVLKEEDERHDRPFQDLECGCLKTPHNSNKNANVFCVLNKKKIIVFHIYMQFQANVKWLDKKIRIVRAALPSPDTKLSLRSYFMQQLMFWHSPAPSLFGEVQPHSPPTSCHCLAASLISGFAPKLMTGHSYTLH